ncbi:hypothetical protein IW261DRAFT_1073118 [Armillaria novae-zelandiae]|uniref:DUF6534 domain-containing protein n=1 Tax=Armillaria novae-zelandiae TaxID=153914 RepID=A0AA39PC10_9AGAR|nr:hypothetical protein IW261DRAFT_1073118 [Armillaria novae-zelandiae]
MHHPVGIYIEYISVIINAVLWGLTCVQTFQYFVYHHRRDHLSLKLLVIFLWICDTLHTAFLSHGFWRVIDNNVSPLVIEVWYLYTSIPTGIVASTTQLFFTWRIWRFCSDSRWRPVVILLVPASLYAFPGILAFTIICQNPGASISSQAVTRLLESIWGVSATVDILISASLLSILWAGRRDTFKSTTQVLHRLSIVIVNTGLWTSVVTLLTLVGLVVWEAQDVYAALSFITCPLYCNTVLANLNTRDYVKRGLFPNESEAETASVFLFETHTGNQRNLIPLNDRFMSDKRDQTLGQSSTLV